MYIKEVSIKNIRSISNFEMKFEKPAGWHVIIGDNGSGKSSVLRSIGLSLIGENQILGIAPNWNNWISTSKNCASIKLEIQQDGSNDLGFASSNAKSRKGLFLIENIIETKNGLTTRINQNSESIFAGHFSEISGWFSAGFGPFRRFSGGTNEYKQITTNPSYKILAAHLTLFKEEADLSDVLLWLKELQLQKFEEKNNYINSIISLINSDGFLPNGVKLQNVSSYGVVFVDANNISLNIQDLSDGFRSILCLVLELMRQIINSLNVEHPIFNFSGSNSFISIPGVILIDEIDAHLHPTWQTRIGQWFTKYFPNIQFIVTTHSPLICRAAENGSIWRLAAPGSNEESGEVTGIDRDRLIYGNVLDAYGTEVFGKSVSISKTANDKLKRMGELNIKSLLGDKMSKKEETELFDLKSVFPTERTQ